MGGLTRTACVVFGLVVRAVAQSTINVRMGVNGNFFDPPMVSALRGDIVTFLFLDQKHGVTQSSLQDPCLPLPGGFNSGLAGPGADRTAPAESWSIEITNDTTPIWFFCQATRPISHCGAGMVGVINPPSPDAYRTFLAAAKDVTSTPTPVIQTVLNGVGASATSPPTALADSNGLTTILVTSTVTSDPSSTLVPGTGSGSNRAPLIAGSLVGGVGLGIIVALAFLFFRRRIGAKRNNSTTEKSWSKEGTELSDGAVYSAGKKFTQDVEGNPFAQRQISLTSRDGARSTDQIRTRWSPFQHDVRAQSPASAASFPLPIMSPDESTGQTPTSQSRGFSGGRSITSASTSSSQRGRAIGTSILQASNRTGNAAHTGGVEMISSGDHPHLGEEVIHHLSSQNTGTEIGLGQVPRNLAHQPSASSSGMGSSRQADFNYRELAKEVASLLQPQLASVQAQSPVSPPPPAQQSTSQPTQTQLTEKQQLEQHYRLTNTSEDQRYSVFPSPTQFSSPSQPPQRPPRPLPSITGVTSRNGRDGVNHRYDDFSDRITVAETELPEYARSIT